MVIGLYTDFGSKGSYYVASMKGVILKINPNIKIIDISHNISPYSIIEASYLIKSTYKFFPLQSVFIFVIDPGVGSSRNILAVKTKSNFYFVGPDNGIFYNILDQDDISECYKVENDEYFNKPISNTFHGRDIMSPVGAYISKGLSLDIFGPKFDSKSFIKYNIFYQIFTNEKKIQGIIQYIDSFGNITTNIPIENENIKGSSLKIKEGDNIKIKFKNQEYEGKFTFHFAKVPIRSLLFLKGSSGFLEISINQGNAAEHIGFKVGDIIIIVLQM